jgi:intergrase/recombinase
MLLILLSGLLIILSFAVFILYRITYDIGVRLNAVLKILHKYEDETPAAIAMSLRVISI